MVFLNPGPAPKPDALKQSQIDQFAAHVRTVIEGATGQPFGTRASDAVSVFARIIADSGKGCFTQQGAELSARWMIGACEVIADTYKPAVVHQPNTDAG